MVKQPACAAASSSSGLVPFSFSNLVLKEYGVSASTPESVERFPLPARPVPRQTAFALRIMLHILAVACSSSLEFISMTIFGEQTSYRRRTDLRDRYRNRRT